MTWFLVEHEHEISDLYWSGRNDFQLMFEEVTNQWNRARNLICRVACSISRDIVDKIIRGA